MRVIIIGGGASGLASAIVAARKGCEVYVLERNSSCGKKILATGNGKCNYYNADQDLRHYHSSNVSLIDKIINKSNCELVLQFFDSLGVVPRIRDGYYYPFSNQAVSVLNALSNEIEFLGVKVINEVFVKEIVKDSDGFLVMTDKGDFSSDRVVVASGSYSYYKNVSVNSYDLLVKLGHRIVKPLPALVQLKVDNSICKKWAGVRVSSLIELYEDGVNVLEEDGELMLTSYGISGICAMQFSGRVARGIDVGKSYDVVINFVKDISLDVDSFVQYLDYIASKVSDRKVSNILDNLLNYKLGNAILSVIGIDGDCNYWKLSSGEKRKIADAVVSFRVRISGTNGYAESQVCSGGVSLLDINCDTMESLRVSGLYVCGEVIDVNGDCGGYNLTFAFLTGILAGMNVGGVISD